MWYLDDIPQVPPQGSGHKILHAGSSFDILMAAKFPFPMQYNFFFSKKRASVSQHLNGAVAL